MTHDYDPTVELATILNGECFYSSSHTGISMFPYYDTDGDLVSLHMACAECLEVLNAQWQAERFEGVVIPTAKHYAWTYDLNIHDTFKANDYDNNGVREALDYINPTFWKASNW